MKTFARWWRFNVVGAIGAGVQLGILAVLSRWWRGHCLLASAIAVEVTVLHNFVWHVRYTWRERREAGAWRHAMWRFHISNGLVSMVGNLVLMKWLLSWGRVPVLVANGVAIVCCSLVNFWMAEVWAFAGLRRRVSSAGVTGVCRGPVLVLMCLALAVTAGAQTPVASPVLNGSESSSESGQSAKDTLVQAPTPQAKPTTVYQASASESYLTHVGVLCGAGASTSPAGTKPTVGCGVGFSFVPLPIFIEVGVMGPQANRSYVSGYVSLDTSVPLAPPTTKYLPQAIVGYSRLFETGHALDYGVALGLPPLGRKRNEGGSVRIELRDYWTFANPAQHNVMLRIGWMGVEAD